MAASADAVRAACGRDLLALLTDGGASLPADRAAALSRCVRHLKPPPAPPAVRRLGARLALKRTPLRRELRDARLPVPDVEGASAQRCQLCRAPYGRRFASAAVQRHFARVFLAAATQCGVTLSRFDLFHGHLFAARGALGLLLHAREYPQRCAEFPVDLGFCQVGSSLEWNAQLMAQRNLLYVVPADGTRAATLCQLDTAPGSLLHAELLAEGVRALHTVYEHDVGTTTLLGDINYLHAARRALPEHRLYVCA